jgi:hypothetical protein
MIPHARLCHLAARKTVTVDRRRRASACAETINTAILTHERDRLWFANITEFAFSKNEIIFIKYYYKNAFVQHIP